MRSFILFLAMMPMIVSAQGLVEPSPAAAAWASRNIIEIKPSTILKAPGYALPAVVDNSTDKAFPPIGNQGDLGSCAAWSTTYYAATYAMAKLNGWDAKNDPSKRLSPKFTYTVGTGADVGSSVESNAMVLSHMGALTMTEMPYDNDCTTWPNTTEQWETALSRRMVNMIGLVTQIDTQAGLDNMKAMLSAGMVMPIMVYIRSFNYKMTSEATPRMVVYQTTGQDGGHTLAVVGYDDNLWCDVNGNGVVDNGELGALKAANSWGGNGYVWIAYDALRTTSAVSGWTPPTTRRPTARLNRAYYITARPYPYVPKLMFRFKLEAASKLADTALWVGSTETGFPFSMHMLDRPKSVYPFNGWISTDLDAMSYGMPESAGRTLWLKFMDGDPWDGKYITVSNLSLVDDTGAVSLCPEQTKSINGGEAILSVDRPIPRTKQTVSFTGTYDGKPGDVFTLSATASSGLPVNYTSDNSSVATVSGSTLTLVADGTANITASQAGDNTWMPAQASVSVKVTSIIVPSYTLTVNGGTGSGSYKAGTSVAISAQAPDNMVFTRWTGAEVANASTSTTTLVMPANDTSVTAVFTDKLYTLTVNGGTGSGQYKVGTSVTVMADTPADMVFTSWSGYAVASSTDPSTTLTMPASDASLTANFTDKLYALTVTNGTGSGKYKRGTNVSLIASVPTNKVFTKWTGHKVDSETSIATSMAMPNADTSVTAVLADRLYTLTVVNGTGSGSYTAGTVVSVVAADPPSGGYFDHWDGQVANMEEANTTVTMPSGDTTVVATYGMMEWKTTASVSSTRSISKGRPNDNYSATITISFAGKGPTPLDLLPEGTDVAMSIGQLELTGKSNGINPKSGSGKFTLEGDGATATVSCERKRISITLKRKDNGSLMMDLSNMDSGKVNGTVKACLSLGDASWDSDIPWNGYLKKDKRTGISTWSVSGRIK